MGTSSTTVGNTPTFISALKEPRYVSYKDHLSRNDQHQGFAYFSQYWGHRAMNYSIAKYQGKWAVLDGKAGVYYFIGAGLAYCKQRAAELNRGV